MTLHIFLRLSKASTLGAIYGALFGVFFGIVASIFHNGPSVHIAIAQSWWWFALSGMFMGFGAERNRISDEKKVS